MPKNKKGGKKHKRGKKQTDDSNVRKNVELAENNQEYAKVLSRLGGSRLEVECTDGRKRQAIIPGKFKKRIWMNPGDIILVSVDAIGDDNVCAVDRKYNNKEIITLKQKGLIKFDGDDETNRKFEYEFKSTENNLNKKESNVVDQYLLPPIDSEDDNDYELDNSNSDSLEIASLNNFQLTKTKGSVDKQKGGKIKKKPTNKETNDDEDDDDQDVASILDAL